MNEIDNLKTLFEEFLTAHNLTAMKFAQAAQINPIKLYNWLNNYGYELDNLTRAQIVNYINMRKDELK